MKGFDKTSLLRGSIIQLVAKWEQEVSRYKRIEESRAKDGLYGLANDVKIKRQTVQARINDVKKVLGENSDE